MFDPVWVAYHHHHHHAPAAPAGPTAEGRCCRCGQMGLVAPTRSVISAKFTGFDQMGAGDGLCLSCAWSFSAPARRLILAISTSTAILLDTPGLFARLLRPATGSDCLVVPISGRKHVLPYARWGTVRVDDINLTWRASDVHRLHVLAELRARGAPSTSLSDPAPPSAWLTKQPRETWEATYRQWRELEPWRPSPQLDLAIKSTNHLKGTSG